MIDVVVVFATTLIINFDLFNVTNAFINNLKSFANALSAFINNLKSLINALFAAIINLVLSFAFINVFFLVAITQICFYSDLFTSIEFSSFSIGFKFCYYNESITLITISTKFYAVVDIAKFLIIVEIILFNKIIIYNFFAAIVISFFNMINQFSNFWRDIDFANFLEY